METLPWYVVTGVPSSGKTTLLDRLSSLYCAFPEAARVIIDKGNAKGIPTKEIRKDELHFLRRVMNLKRYFERIAPRDVPVFFDRGLHDNIAYYRLHGFDTAELDRYLMPNVYRAVFLLEPLPYEQYYARTESPEQVARLHELFREAYEEYGYAVIDVPAFSGYPEDVSVRKRAEFVLDRI